MLWVPTASASASTAAKAPARSVAPLRTSAIERCVPALLTAIPAPLEPLDGLLGSRAEQDHMAHAPDRQSLGIIAGNTSRAAERQDVVASRPDDSERLEDVGGEEHFGRQRWRLVEPTAREPLRPQVAGAAVETPAAQANDLTFGTCDGDDQATDEVLVARGTVETEPGELRAQLPALLQLPAGSAGPSDRSE